MNLTAITEATEIKKAYARFAKRLITGAKTYRRVVGWQGGSEEHTVYWRAEHSLSVVLAPNPHGNRTWNVFGSVDPADQPSLGIICEINFPHRGMNRRIAGAFAKDGNGRIFITHSGKIGGGRTGIGKNAFIDSFGGRDQWVKIHWPGKHAPTDAIVIADLDAPRLVDHIAYFVREVDRFKIWAASQTAASTIDTVKKPPPSVTFSPEFTGEKQPYKTESTITARCDHGLVVGALREAIQKSRGQQSFRCGNNRFRDLYLAQGQQMVALFEVKTDLSTTSLYAAVGQLLLNGADEKRRPLSVVVVPGEPKPTTAARLQRLGLQVLPYTWEKNRPTFPKLDQILQRL